MSIRIEDLRTDRIVLREFRESDVWEGFDAQQIAVIAHHPKNISSRRVAEKLGYQKLSGKYYLMVNGTKEPREKYVLMRNNFYLKKF